MARSRRSPVSRCCSFSEKLRHPTTSETKISLPTQQDASHGPSHKPTGRRLIAGPGSRRRSLRLSIRPFQCLLRARMKKSVTHAALNLTYVRLHQGEAPCQQNAPLRLRPRNHRKGRPDTSLIMRLCAYEWLVGQRMLICLSTERQSVRRRRGRDQLTIPEITDNRSGHYVTRLSLSFIFSLYRTVQPPQSLQLH